MNKKGLPAQGRLHLKFLGMASYGGKCNQLLGSLKAVVCKVWTLDQWHRHDLGTC